eukprot:14829474-Alexandrium_andersonii.AAC.1
MEGGWCPKGTATHCARKNGRFPRAGEKWRKSQEQAPGRENPAAAGEPPGPRTPQSPHALGARGNNYSLGTGLPRPKE